MNDTTNPEINMNSELLEMLADLEAVNYELGYHDGQGETLELKRSQLRESLKQALNGNKE